MRNLLLLSIPVVCGYMIRVTPLSAKTNKYCINCSEHFVENKEYKCRLFYNLDIITGRRNFYTCNMSRKNDSLCGEEARHFFPNSSFGSVEPCSNNDI